MILWDNWSKAVEFSIYEAHIEEWFKGDDDDDDQIVKNDESKNEEIKDTKPQNPETNLPHWI